ncbi:MAG: YHS domain-containing protein [Planctomycetales bacterium]|nr:YHS domain-containing protein [Planctomycetales bacterium]
MRTLLKIFLPYSLLIAMGVAVWLSNRQPAADSNQSHIDPVCHMEVTPSWGFAAKHDGHDYFFCTKACRDRFAATPSKYLGDRCVVCKSLLDTAEVKTATYLGKTYQLCGEEHRQQFKADPAAFFMHTMWGIPSWMYYVSIACVMVVSFGTFESLDRITAGQRREDWQLPVLGEVSSHARQSVGELGSSLIPPRSGERGYAVQPNRLNVLDSRIIRWLVTSRPFRFALQLIVVSLFFLVIAAGLFGNQNPAMNIAPILTWTVWWGGLVILIMFAGKAWCFICPWDAVAGWMEKLRFWKKSNEGLSLNLKWPHVARNVVIATVLFVGLTWIELGFGVTMRPVVTAYLAIAMLLMAIVSAFLFEKKGFCRYACIVGRVSGLYAMFSGVEIRSKDATVCKDCRTKECVHGSETAYGCPTFLYPGNLATNTYCIQCSECLQACPHDNLALNLRPWGEDLVHEHRPRTDESYLALLMLSITGFHGLTMTPNWARLTEWLNSSFSAGRLLSFTLGMAALMAAPILIYAVLVWVSLLMTNAEVPNDERSSNDEARNGNGHAVSSFVIRHSSFLRHWVFRHSSFRNAYRDYFIRYSYALLPIALFYHLAHNLEHLLMEGPKVVTLISDPFGWGQNWFGTARWNVPPLVSLDVLWGLQVLLVLVGHVYSLWVAQRTSVRMFGSRSAAFRSQLPMLAGMIAFSVFSLWLLKQPMEMRTSAM